MSVIAMVRLTARPGQRDALMETMNAAVSMTREQPRCHKVDMLAGLEGDHDVLLIEHWDSVDDHRLFINGVIEAGGLDGIIPLLARDIETLHYTAVGSD